MPRNGFEYQFADAGHTLLADLDSRFADTNWVEAVAIPQWRQNAIWQAVRVYVVKRIETAEPVSSERLPAGERIW